MVTSSGFMKGPPKACSKKTLALSRGCTFAGEVILYLGPVGLGGRLFGNINATLPSIGAAGAIHLGRF